MRVLPREVDPLVYNMAAEDPGKVSFIHEFVFKHTHSSFAGILLGYWRPRRPNPTDP